ncbi:MAG TPA: hypothetical protein VFU86_09595, partial [Terriglobales bacterium]|nr:hypothetical protein [Terriglobales bacterium]
MRYVFWISLAFVAYAYFGYPLVLWVLSIVRPRRIAKASVEPEVSVLIAVHNEAGTLRAKIQNLGQVDYPPDKM